MSEKDGGGLGRTRVASRWLSEIKYLRAEVKQLKIRISELEARISLAAWQRENDAEELAKLRYDEW